MTFAKSPGSVSAARRFSRDALRDLPPNALELVELMVSELATNCIRHSDSAFDVLINRTQDDVRIEVSDRAGGTPAVRSPGPEEPRGRGLRSWRCSPRIGASNTTPGDGKTVWFVVSTAAQSAA